MDSSYLNDIVHLIQKQIQVLSFSKSLNGWLEWRVKKRLLGAWQSKDDSHYLVLLPVCLQLVHQKTGHFPSGSNSCLCFICRWDGVHRTRTGCSILHRLLLTAPGIVPLVLKKISDLCRNSLHVSLLLG